MSGKVKVELIYRVITEVAVNAESYSNEVLGLDADAEITDAERVQLATEYERNMDEGELYSNIFADQIESEGPDGFYCKVVGYDEFDNELASGQHDDSNYDDVKQTL